MNREKALDRLEEINNNLTLLMREKKGDSRLHSRRRKSFKKL